MGKVKKQKRDAAKAIELQLAAVEVKGSFHACAHRKESCLREAQSSVAAVSELTTRGIVANSEAADGRVASERA